MKNSISGEFTSTQPIKLESKLTDMVVINMIMNNSHDTIYFKDVESKFILVSKAQALCLNLEDPKQAIGRTDFDFFAEEFARQAFEDEQRIMTTRVPIIGKVEKLQWPNGRIMWVSASKYPLFDLRGNVLGTWGSSRDITDITLAKEELEKLNEQLREANMKLRILSSVDSLSGLYNQRVFHEEFQKHFLALEGYRESESIFSLIVIDIDFFKSINDSEGHLFGDTVIKTVSKTIKSSIRSSDKAFRYGGDEFIILLPGATREHAFIVAEKIRSAVEQSEILHKFNTLKVTVSAGVSSSDEAGGLNELMEIADKRLYESKNRGRNCVT